MFFLFVEILNGNTYRLNKHLKNMKRIYISLLAILAIACNKNAPNVINSDLCGFIAPIENGVIIPSIKDTLVLICDDLSKYIETSPFDIGRYRAYVDSLSVEYRFSTSLLNLEKEKYEKQNGIDQYIIVDDSHVAKIESLVPLAKNPLGSFKYFYFDLTDGPEVVYDNGCVYVKILDLSFDNTPKLHVLTDELQIVSPYPLDEPQINFQFEKDGQYAGRDNKLLSFYDKTDEGYIYTLKYSDIKRGSLSYVSVYAHPLGWKDHTKRAWIDQSYDLSREALDAFLPVLPLHILN